MQSSARHGIDIRQNASAETGRIRTEPGTQYDVPVLVLERINKNNEPTRIVCTSSPPLTL